MKTTADYIAQAAHNADLAEHLRQSRTDCLDWAVTCLFYAAIHYVNAYMVWANIPIPKRHRSKDVKNPGRTDIVDKDPTLSTIYCEYRHLDDESRDARYELKKPTKEDYDLFLLVQFEKIRVLISKKVSN